MEKRVIAYVADWSFLEDIQPAQARLLTHVNYAFGLIRDGEVSVAHAGQWGRMARMRMQYPHLKVNLSIGGWGADGFSQAVATREGRERLACSALHVLKNWQLDGIDWDWEYPGSSAAGIASHPEDPRRMTELLSLMREMLDDYGRETGRYYEQSIAVGAERVHDYIWERAMPALDTVNLMTYDMSMPGACGHVTNVYKAETAAYSVEESVRDFAACGISREKLLLGAAFYCHAYAGVQLPRPMGKPCEKRQKSLPHDAIDETWAYHWDDQAGAAYWLKGNTALTGDDEHSLSLKRKFIEEEGLGGVIIWELSHDRKNLLLPVLADEGVCPALNNG